MKPENISFLQRLVLYDERLCTKHHITQVCQSPLQSTFGSLRLLAFPKAKITVEKEGDL